MVWTQSKRVECVISMLYAMREMGMRRGEAVPYNSETLLGLLVAPDSFLNVAIGDSVLDKVHMVDAQYCWSVIRRDISERFPMQFTEEQLGVK